MATASSPLNNTPPVRVCSEKHCQTILGFGPFKGNLCPQCTAKMRSRRSLLSAKSASIELGNDPNPISWNPEAIMSCPSTVADPSVARKGTTLPLPLEVLSQTYVNATTFPESQPGRPQRPFFAIPHQQPKLLRVPSSVVAGQSNAPLLNHFNSRGEIIDLTKYRADGNVVNDFVKPEDLAQTLQSRSEQSPSTNLSCTRCRTLMPAHYLGDVCPSCRVEMSTSSGKINLRTTMITPAEMSSLPFSPGREVSRANQTVGVSEDVMSIYVDTNKTSVDDDGDVDMENLELAYPEVPDAKSNKTSEAAGDAPTTKRIRLSYVPCPGTPNPGRWKDKQVKSQSVIRPPIIGLPCRPRLPKVQNARNTAVIDLARSPSPTIANKTKPPSVSDPKAVKPGQNNSQAFRSLKLCSNANCTGIISVDSVATRCLDCVRRDWRSKRSKFSAKSSNIDNSGGAGRIASGILKAQESTKEKTKKKGVTWADEITSASSETEKLTEEGFPAMPNNSTADTDHKISVSEDNLVDNTVNLEDYLNLDDLIEQDSHIQDVSMQPLLDKDSSQVVQKASDSQAFAFDNASGRPAATEVPFIDGHGMAVQSHTSPSPAPEGNSSKNISGPRAENSSQADALTSFAGQVTGWDSDLTELSDSGDGESHESSSSDSDSDNVHQPSTPSGLKIRIPARPGGIYAQKCASSSKCNQVLATSYRWKSCVMCRARSRDYQRKRQNIQGRHARLDQELLQSQNMGTPLAGDLQVTEKVEDPVTLVPGARLCSIRNCTYIIPPMEEYRWKMCALCRLRRRERSKQDKLSNLPLAATESLRPSEGKKRRLDADLILKALNNLPLQPQTRPGGRCQSVDCGMLIVDPKSAQCTQCIARRLWLMNRSGNNGSRPDMKALSRRSNYVEKPRDPSPYPQFKCFSAFLLEFKHRLAGFLRAQSVFFLFKGLGSMNAMFAFDGEFSVVALDFDLLKRKDEMDANSMKLKREIEYVGRIKFSPKRLVSILDGGGIAVRFGCVYAVPILQPMLHDNKTSITTITKNMRCELEIANVPDRSHRFIPGQRTIIRFRLLG